MLNNYFRQLTCKHEWEYVGELITQKLSFNTWHIRVYHCKKCGKFREEDAIE